MDEKFVALIGSRRKKVEVRGCAISDFGLAHMYDLKIEDDKGFLARGTAFRLSLSLRHLLKEGKIFEETADFLIGVDDADETCVYARAVGADRNSSLVNHYDRDELADLSRFVLSSPLIRLRATLHPKKAKKVLFALAKDSFSVNAGVVSVVYFDFF